MPKACLKLTMQARLASNSKRSFVLTLHVCATVSGYGIQIPPSPPLTLTSLNPEPIESMATWISAYLSLRRTNSQWTKCNGLEVECLRFHAPISYRSFL